MLCNKKKKQLKKFLDFLLIKFDQREYFNEAGGNFKQTII